MLDDAKARSSDSIHSILRVAFPACLWLIALTNVARLGPLLATRGTQTDFSIYMLSGHAFNSNENPYRADFDTEAREIGVNNLAITNATDPPTFILLFAPLSRLPPQKAFSIWTTINGVALIAAMLIIVGPGSGIPGWIAWSFAAVAMIYPPVIASFYNGQNKILLMLLLALMMRSMRSGNDAVSGLALGLAGLTRIFPFLMIAYLVIERRWGALKYTFLCLIVCIPITIALFGLSNSLSFGRDGVNLLTAQRYLSQPQNIALDAYISRWLWSINGPGLSPSYEALRRVAIVIGDLLIFFVTLRATISIRRCGDDNLRFLSLWIVTSILLSPTVWVFYLVLLLIPFAQIAAACSAGEVTRRTLWSAGISVLLIFLAISPHSEIAFSTNPWLRMTIGECRFYSLIAAYLSVYFFAIDQTEAVHVPLRIVPALAWQRLSGAEAN